MRRCGARWWATGWRGSSPWVVWRSGPSTSCRSRPSIPSGLDPGASQCGAAPASQVGTLLLTSHWVHQSYRRQGTQKSAFMCRRSAALHTRDTFDHPCHFWSLFIPCQSLCCLCSCALIRCLLTRSLVSCILKHYTFNHIFNFPANLIHRADTPLTNSSVVPLYRQPACSNTACALQVAEMMTLICPLLVLLFYDHLLEVLFHFTNREQNSVLLCDRPSLFPLLSKNILFASNLNIFPSFGRPPASPIGLKIISD